MSKRSRAGTAKELRRRGETSYRSRSQCHGSTTKRTSCCVNQWLGFESPRLHRIGVVRELPLLHLTAEHAEHAEKTRNGGLILTFMHPGFLRVAPLSVPH